MKDGAFAMFTLAEIGKLSARVRGAAESPDYG
jgi:hypothetical protein